MTTPRALALTPTKASTSKPTSSMPAAASLLMRLLAGIRHGALRVVLPNGQLRHFGDRSAATAVSLELVNWNVASAVLRAGDIGMAETFIAGDWHSDDLPALLELLVRNRDDIEALVYGAWWGRLLYRVKHLLNRNTRSGSRKNIHAHYDLGNDFYRLWLDPSMSYSSALQVADRGLEQAQAAKYQRVMDQLHLKKGDRVLEIGCGWGGFAEAALRAHAVTLTGLTLSTQQLDYAIERMRQAGLADHSELQLRDYRDCAGQYDAIASIEMFEAVGESYWPSYFECLARNLKQGGRACVQTIVIADALFARYRTGTDFIQQYIFPGGMLPSPSVFREMAQAHGFDMADEFDFGDDYAATLASWRSAFHAQLAEVRALGFDQRFIHIWEFYLCYCEAAFRGKNTSVMQFTLVKR
jgi:cyclopropane-fatty-acyl-phospholipid synthase